MSRKSKHPTESRTAHRQQPVPALLTRRQTLHAATGTAILAAASAAIGPAAAAHESDPEEFARLEASFDENWRFHRGDLPDAQHAAFDDRAWRQLDLPHDWRIEDLPYAASDDGGATANPSGLAFQTSPSTDGTPPSAIGPFDVNADPVPDIDVTYPGYGQIVIPGGRFQGYTVAGIGWYRKTFRLPPLERRHVELRFDGIYQNSDVWLNGVHLGFHPNGYTSFSYDLTPHLDPRGNNVLAVRVDNSGKTSRWYSGSGIYRHTWLTITSLIRIPLYGIQVTTPTVSDRHSVVDAVVQVTNAGGGADALVRMILVDPGNRPVAVQLTASRRLPAGTTTSFPARFALPDASLWSPEAPNLYRLRAEIVVDARIVDALDIPFGIRSLVFNGAAGFLLNGRPYTLRGGNIHHDHGPLGTVAIDRAEERKIELLKAAGLNAIRASHNPRSPYMLDVCDRLGMLVYNEFSDMWDVAKLADDYHKYFPDWWQRDLTSMVQRDRNHPSVIIWSVGNEILTDPNQYGPRLAALIRSLDPTRPIAQGGQNIGPSGADVWSYVDVGDYHGTPPAADLAAHPDKAFLQSEDTSPFIYDDHLLAQTSSQYIGSLVWSGQDYIGESGIGAAVASDNLADATAIASGDGLGRVPYPYSFGLSGDIDLIGQRKPQSHYRAVVNGFSPLEMMVVRPVAAGLQQFNVGYAWYDELPSWSWDVPAGQLLTVHVYTAGDSVTLLLNGTVLETRTLADSDRWMASFSVPYAAGRLTAVARSGGAVLASRTLSTTGPAASLRLDADVSFLTTSRGDLAHILVQVTDDAGQIVPDAVVKVAFAVEGAGRLVAAGNGNPHNVDSYQRPRHWTWHGRALVVLQPAKHPGILTLRASADGLPSTSLVLPVAAAF